MKIPSLNTFALVFLITGAIDSIRNLPAMALFGDALIFFFFLSVILFLLPVALVSAVLSAKWPEHGGVFHWVRRAYGEKAALLSVWLQWINTIVWLPTILSFMAVTSAYLIDPALAKNGIYLFSVILLLNFLLTFTNLKGIKVSSSISTFCAITGTIAPIILILVLGLIWLYKGMPLAIQMDYHHLLPQFNKSDSFVSLTAIITSFLGVELASVHIKDVHNPSKTFPKALAISVFIIIATIFCGAMVIAMVLPKAKIGFVNGIPEVFAFFLSAFHLKGLLPIIICFMLIGSFGGIISWFISPAKGLLQAVEYGYMPQVFGRLNSVGVPYNLLLLQSALTFILSTSFLFIPKMNSLYWFFTDLSTELYVLMYVLMFLAAFKLTKEVTENRGTFRVPGGKFGYVLVVILGFIGSLFALVAGFVPPDAWNISNKFAYPFLFAVAMMVMMTPLFFLYRYADHKKKQVASLDRLQVLDKTA